MYGSMFRVCQRYVVNMADAEDCLMLGFMKVFQNIEKFIYDGEKSFFHWVRRIMVNESLMFLRRKNNFRMVVDDEIEDVALESSVMEKIDAEELLGMIMQLPPGYRTVFNLNVIEGYEHKEIASILNISENTSRTQLAKARYKLQGLITKNEMTWKTGRIK